MACPDCVTGTLHEGTPAGKIETVHGLDTYIASPPDGVDAKATIVIIPDAFGWNFNNNRILADNYAKKGSFRVLLPNFMGAGGGMTPEVLGIMDYVMAKHDSFGIHTFWKGVYVLRAASYFVPWILKNRWQRTWPGCQQWFEKLRAETQHKIGAAGFCWGGKHVFLLLGAGDATIKDGKGLIDAGYTAHPSFLTLPDDAQKVKLPVSVAIGTVDMQIPKDKIPTLESGLKGSGTEYELKVYQDATHGFAVRANPAVPKENEQGIEAEDQAVAWFTKHLV